jgi:hypothetical protein
MDHFALIIVGRDNLSTQSDMSTENDANTVEIFELTQQRFAERKHDVLYHAQNNAGMSLS